MSELSPPSLSWKDKTRIFRLASLKPAGFCTWSCYLSVLSLQYNNTITQKWVHTNFKRFLLSSMPSSMPSSWTNTKMGTYPNFIFKCFFFLQWKMAFFNAIFLDGHFTSEGRTKYYERKFEDCRLYSSNWRTLRTNWRCCPRLRLSGFQTSDTHTYTLHFFRQLFKHIWLNLALKFANCSRFLLEASSDFAFFHSSYLWLQSQRYVSWSSWKGVGASGRLGVSAGITVSHPEK